jgi:Na+:H+ antiporter, NhaA family
MLQSGVHVTLAGILLAFTIPASNRIDIDTFLRTGRVLLDRVQDAGMAGKEILTNEDQKAAIHALENASEKALPPLARMKHSLHPWVSYAIMAPLRPRQRRHGISGEFSPSLVNPITMGVFLGLVLGKQVGLTLASWLAVRLGIASMPRDLTWRHLYGAGWLGGIGFTMALFISNLAFIEMPQQLFMAKIGILAASSLSGMVGFLILMSVSQRQNEA